MCALLSAALFLSLCGCGPLSREQRPRFFWPPPPGEAKIEYINYYFSNEDLLRGVDRRLENAILGQRQAERVIIEPFSVASDGKGRIFVGDLAGSRVTILDLSTHEFRQLLQLEGAPQKVLVDKRGEIWVLDATNTIVYRFSAEEEQIDELKLKGMGRVASMTVDSELQRLYLSDVSNHRICVYDYQGTMLQTIGVRGRALGELNFPTDLDLDTSGNLYVVDSMNARIQVFSSAGVFIRAFGERGTGLGSFANAKGIAVSPSHLVYVTDSYQNKVVIFNARGDYLLTLGGRYVFDGRNIQPGGFYYPLGIDVDANDTIFIADFFNGMIHEFQYLTPEFLAQHPIRAGEVYTPQAADFYRNEGKGAKELPPVTAPGQEEKNESVLHPLKVNKR